MTTAEFLGSCEGCGKALYEGMRGHICDGGDPIFCADMGAANG